MNILSIGTHDPAIFNEKSALRQRTEAYARALGHLILIDTTTRHEAFKPYHTEHFSVYGTNSWSRLLSPFDAARIARTVGGDVVTTQDPFEHGLAGVLASRALHVPLHVQLHTDPFSPGFARVSNVGHRMSYINRCRLWLMPFVLRRASRIRVVSKRLKSKIEQRYRPNAHISVLPIYTDLERFHAIKRAPENGTLLWIDPF